MQRDQFARLYNGFQTPATDAPRFIDKDRDQPRHQEMAGRGFSGSNVGFHIELGEEREAERRRVVYDSSGRDHEHWSAATTAAAAAAAAATNTSEDHHGPRGVPGNESFTRSGSHSDGSEDYEEEELDLEADGRDVLERNSLGQAAGGGVQEDGFRSEAGAGAGAGASKGSSSSHHKFGVFPFFNSFPGHENGARGRDEGGGAAEGNGVSDSMFFNPVVGEKRVVHGQENSVRHFLSDPISGVLMDDAVIFPCGHSVGNAGYLRVQETNACVVCMLPIAPGSAAPNLALRAAVQAYRRDREFPIMTSSRSAKRKREDDETGKVKGVQFPYTVGDRVLIKGNKRTPERFVGREAIITTQCLNGWYLVRTVDNGESVRLQYRSLQKQGE